MTTLHQLEAQLRASGKFWLYDSRICDRNLAEDQKIAVAQLVLAAGKSWAQGLNEEFVARTYPPGYDEQ